MMSWRVLGSVICPKTGIVYSNIVRLKSIRLMIWYESDIFLLPGDRVRAVKNGIFINGVFSHITLYNVAPYNDFIWNEIKNKTVCPFNKNLDYKKCTYSVYCNARKCPHGFETNPLVIKMNHD